MENQAVTHSTFVIERNYPAPPERVFAAFTDPVRKSRWLGGERSTTLESNEMDFRVGGWDRTRYRFKEGTLFPGVLLANDSVYQDIVPNRRIVWAYTMTLGENRMSASLATFEFVPSAEGTTLVFTDQGAYFEGSDGPQLRQDGWTKLLDNLGREAA